MHRCNVSFAWSAVPVIKMFLKGQNVNILTILHVHRRRVRFWQIPANQRQFLDVQQSGFAGRNLFRFDVIWMKRSSSGFSFVLLWPLSPSQPCLQETIEYSVSKCFKNIKMKKNIINVDTSFRHANYSAACVSGRLLRFRIPKVYKNFCYVLMCSSKWPYKHVLISKYFPYPSIYKGKRDSSRIISQQWLWSDSKM